MRPVGLPLFDPAPVGAYRYRRKATAFFRPSDTLLVIAVESCNMLLMAPTGSMGWDQDDYTWSLINA